MTVSRLNCVNHFCLYSVQTLHICARHSMFSSEPTFPFVYILLFGTSRVRKNQPTQWYGFGHANGPAQSRLFRMLCRACSVGTWQRLSDQSVKCRSLTLWKQQLQQAHLQRCQLSHRQKVRGKVKEYLSVCSTKNSLNKLYILMEHVLLMNVTCLGTQSISGWTPGFEQSRPSPEFWSSCHWLSVMCFVGPTRTTAAIEGVLLHCVWKGA